MTLGYGKKVMIEVIKNRRDLGKTAIMKIVFILQQVFGFRLGYDFDIYTYGPYAVDVADDLNMLVQEGFVDADIYEYKNSPAYRFNATEKIKNLPALLLSDDEQTKISQVLTLFGDKNVKELELDSTIIYIKNLYVRNKWDEIKADIINDVHEIKPHFSNYEIESAYDALHEHGMLN